VKQVLLAVVLSLVALCCAAAPPECDLKRFPASWPQAQSRVVWLNSFLETAERAHAFANATAQPFRQALEICRTKREAVQGEPRGPGSPGITSQMKCEALLICARIEAIEME
jgi:hypothetical protein